MILAADWACINSLYLGPWWFTTIVFETTSWVCENTNKQMKEKTKLKKHSSWTWVWTNPRVVKDREVDVLQSRGWHRVGHDLATEQQEREEEPRISWRRCLTPLTSFLNISWYVSRTVRPHVDFNKNAHLKCWLSFLTSVSLSLYCPHQSLKFTRMWKRYLSLVIIENKRVTYFSRTFWMNERLNYSLNYSFIDLFHKY